MQENLIEKCQKILEHGVLLDLLQFHLTQQDEKLWLLFNLFTVGEEAASEVKKLFTEKEICENSANEYEKIIVLEIWNIIDNLEEKHKNTLITEFSALKFCLIKNSVFRKHLDKDFAQKIENKYKKLLEDVRK